jgi:hypothetical protein
MIQEAKRADDLLIEDATTLTGMLGPSAGIGEPREDQMHDEPLGSETYD